MYLNIDRYGQILLLSHTTQKSCCGLDAVVLPSVNPAFHTVYREAKSFLDTMTDACCPLPPDYEGARIW